MTAFGKRIAKYSLLIMVLVSLLLAGCGRNDRPVALPEDAYVYDFFSYNGEIYLLSYKGEDAYVSKMNDPGQSAYRLPGESLPRWSGSDQKLYYGERHKLYHYSLEDHKAETVWTLPNGEKQDYVQAAFLADQLLVIQIFSRVSPIWSDDLKIRASYYVLDLATGEVKQAFSARSYYYQPFFLGCDGEQALYLQKEGGETVFVRSIDLRSLEIRELGQIDYDSNLNTFQTDACALDGTWYFVFDGQELCSVPASGGTVERSVPDKETVGTRTTPVHIGASDGAVYVLMQDDLSMMLCEWDPGSKALVNADSEGRTFQAGGYSDFRIEGGQFSLLTVNEVIRGRLD